MLRDGRRGNFERKGWRLEFWVRVVSIWYVRVREVDGYYVGLVVRGLDFI